MISIFVFFVCVFMLGFSRSPNDVNSISSHEFEPKHHRHHHHENHNHECSHDRRLHKIGTHKDHKSDKEHFIHKQHHEHPHHNLKREETQPPAPIRIINDFSLLTVTGPGNSDAGKACSFVGEIVNPYDGYTTSYTCTAADLLTLSISNIIKNTVVPDATSFLTSFLKMQVPTVGNLVMNEPSGHTCSGIQVPSTYLSPTGTPNADYIMIWTARPISQGNTLAYAGACLFYQYGVQAIADRPLIGYGNINIAKLFDPSADYLDPYYRNYNKRVILHELVHALGFSSAFYKYYYLPTIQFPVASRQFHTGAILNTTMLVSGNLVYIDKITTPNVLTFARNYFNCATLDGVLLENQDKGIDYPTANNHIGSHFENAIAYSELMAPIVTEEPILSGFTLGVLNDMGWYLIDSTTIEERKRFLYKSGCSVINGKCNTWPTRDFCTDGIRYCDGERRVGGICQDKLWGVNLPPQYRYFSDPTQGGIEKYSDYCMVINKFSDKICTRVYANASEPYYVYDDIFGASSGCFEITSSGADAACYPWRCFQPISGPLVLQIQPNSSSWLDCPSSTTINYVTQQSTSITISCPPTNVFCDGVQVVPGGPTNAPTPPTVAPTRAPTPPTTTPVPTNAPTSSAMTILPKIMSFIFLVLFNYL